MNALELIAAFGSARNEILESIRPEMGMATYNLIENVLLSVETWMLGYYQEETRPQVEEAPEPT